MHYFALSLVTTLLMLTLFNCTSVTKQSKSRTILDVSQEADVEGTGMSSADIRSMAEWVALQIADIDFPTDKERIRIALTEIDNQTRFGINPNTIKVRLLADLVTLSRGNRVQFTENPLGADYILSASIVALSKGSAEGVNDYIQYSFKLTDKADTVVWMKNYETKKQGRTGIMYR